MSINIILLVCNEEKTITKDITDIHNKIISKISDCLLIISEDGSTDYTKEILTELKKKYNFTLITEKKRKGYKQSFIDAVKICTKKHIFFSDSGNKFDYDDFWKLYKHANEYDLVSGYRSQRLDSLFRRLLTFYYNLSLRLYFNVKLKDSDSGFKIYNTLKIKKILEIKLINEHLISSEIFLRFLFSNYKTTEVNVKYFQRPGKSVSFSFMKIFKVIFQVISNFKKLKNDLNKSF
tara:strand:+ start:177 stop:881 length:705 start_codon:yes stop_codon:yes gene_type:complete